MTEKLSENPVLIAAVNELTFQNQNLSQRCISLAAEVAKRDMVIEQLNGIATDMRSAMDTLSATINDRDYSIEQFRAEVASLNSEVAALKEAEESLKPVNVLPMDYCKVEN